MKASSPDIKRRKNTPVFVMAVCVVILIACQTKKPEKPVKPITDEPPAKTLQAETLSEIKHPEPVRATKEKKDIAPGVAERSVPLTVVVSNLKSADAPVEMSVYGQNNKFLDINDQIKKYRFKPRDGKVVAKIDDLDYGQFALALYQDVNDDGKIDKNVIGIPEEPYAFSNNYKPVIKAPSFQDCVFDYTPETNTINISLIK